MPRDPTGHGPPDRAFWRRIAPTFHLEEDPVDRPYGGAHPPAVDPAARLLSEGYFEVADIDWGPRIGRLAELVERLVEQGVPPVFAFVYDEAWAAFAALHPILEEALGDGYFRLPDFWAWRIDPKTGASGWAPHRDRGADTLFGDGRPKALSVWIALTDATPLNGCLYLAPADRDPGYGKPGRRRSEIDLQDVRALPAQAGTVVAWTTHVLHWGSRPSPRALLPRVSIAMEFQTAEVPALEAPLTAPIESPPFEMRLKLIEQQIGKYQGWYSGEAASALALWADALRAEGFEGRPDDRTAQAAVAGRGDLRSGAASLWRRLRR
jgi:hypothetical protein